MRYFLPLSTLLASLLCFGQAPAPQWQMAASGFMAPGGNLEEMVFDHQGNAYIAAQHQGIFKSTDPAHAVWNLINTGLTLNNGTTPPFCGTLYKASGYVGLGVTPDGTIVTSDFACDSTYYLNNVGGNGQVWTQTSHGVNLGMLNYGCDIASDHQTLMCGFDSNIRYTSDNGRSWTIANMNGIAGEFLGVFTDPVSGVSYAGIATAVGKPAAIFSTDNGRSWHGIPRPPADAGDGDNAAVNIVPMGPYRGWLIASRSDNKTGPPTIECYGPNPTSSSATWTAGCAVNADSILMENGCETTAWLVRNRTNNRLLRAMFVGGGWPTYTDDGVDWQLANAGIPPDPTMTCTKQPDIQSLTIDPTTGKAWFVTNKNGQVWATTASQDIGTSTKPNPPSNVKATPQ